LNKRNAVCTSFLLAAAVSGLAACSQGSGSEATAVASSAVGDNWDQHGGTADEQRFSGLTEITAENVAKLGLAWSFELDTNRGQEATPLMVDGVLYTTTAWSKVVALDAETGKLLWSYDPKVPGDSGFKACCDVINRGVAYSKGRVFVGTLDGRLEALDAKTGKLVWSTLTVDQSHPYTISGAPRVVKGKVIIGNGGADYGVRGYVTAYDEMSGKQVWRFYTVPGDPAKSDNAASDDVIESLVRKTWFGDDYIKSGGGGTVWDSIVYDEELDQLYIGVGNGSPINHVERSKGKGDNLFLSSIVALNPDTGKYLWHYQEVPGETWDYTATQQITLATMPVGGAQRKVLFQAPKNGFFYIIDRTNGKLLSAEKFAPVNWADRIDMKTGRPVEAAGARYEKEPFLAAVGGAGAHSWHAMSFSPQTGLVYIPAQLIPTLFNREENFSFKPGQWNLGFDMMRTKLPTAAADRKAMLSGLSGWLLAWDPVQQKEVWRVSHGGPWNGGVLSTAGGLVFQGTADRQFVAYDAAKGTKLWSFPASSSIIAAPITYRVKGTQYVAVLAGNGGAIPLALPDFNGPRLQPNGRVLVFKLGGTAKLPEFDLTPPPPAQVAEKPSADQLERGRVMFADNCATCHGLGGWSAGVLPDLRRSGVLGSAEAWQSVVYDGALRENGMISFKPYLTSEQIETIRLYLGTQADALRAEAGAASKQER
jgi:quinohemoprotein ethanol dehydrogenase